MWNISAATNLPDKLDYLHLDITVESDPFTMRLSNMERMTIDEFFLRLLNLLKIPAWSSG